MDTTNKSNHQQEASFIVHLSLGFGDVSRTAESIIGIYIDTEMETDLDELAWNLSDCDEDRQGKEFGSPKIKSSNVSRLQSGEIKADIAIQFSGQSKDRILSLLEDYLDSFDDYIRNTVLEYESRQGNRTGFTAILANKEFEISSVT